MTMPIVTTRMPACVDGCCRVTYDSDLGRGSGAMVSRPMFEVLPADASNGQARWPRPLRHNDLDVPRESGGDG